MHHFHGVIRAFAGRLGTKCTFTLRNIPEQCQNLGGAHVARARGVAMDEMVHITGCANKFAHSG